MENTTKAYLQELTKDGQVFVDTILDICEEHAKKGEDFVNISIPVKSNNEYIKVIETLITEHKLNVEVTATYNYMCFLEISWENG